MLTSIWARSTAAGWLFVCAAGCHGPAPVVNLADDLSRAAGAGGAIAFRTDGGPVDAAGETPGTLALADAVRMALVDSPEIQGALARVRAAEADARQARLLPNPVLNVAVRLPEGGGASIIEAGLAADLLAILQTPGRVRAADHRLRGAAAEALTAVLDVVADVQQHYAAAQALDEQLAALEVRRQTLGRLLELARGRLAANEGNRLDVLALDTQRVELEAEIAERQADRADERLVLARLIGRPSGATDWRLEPWRPAAPPAAGERAWLAAALSGRPEVQAARWELAALGDDAALSRLAAFEGTDVGAAAEREGAWSVGPAVSVPLPLLDWGQERRAKATARQVEARHQLVRAQRLAVEETRRAYGSFAAAGAALAKVESELVPLLDRRRQQVEAAYRVGESDLTALLAAEQEVHAARAKRIDLRRKAAVALSKLQRAVGGPAAAARVDAPAAADTR